MVNEEYNEWCKAMKALNHLMTRYYKVLLCEKVDENVLEPDACYQILKKYLVTHTERVDDLYDYYFEYSKDEAKAIQRAYNLIFDFEEEERERIAIEVLAAYIYKHMKEK